MQAIAEGRKSDAGHMLRKMIDEEPMHAGAWLDLALIQCELGNQLDAERLFAEIETRFTPPQEIRQVIQMRRALGCQSRRKSNWNMQLAYGYEDNVNQGASNPLYTIQRGNTQIELPLTSDFLPKSDHYLQWGAEYNLELNQHGTSLQLQGQGRRNRHLHAYDSASLQIAVEHPLRVGKWTLYGSGMFGFLSLGNKLYQKQTQLQVRVTPPFTLPANLHWQVLASTSHLQYMTLSGFDANTLELRNQLSWQKNNLFLSGGLAALNDHATGDRPGGRRRGWSANLMAQTRLYGNNSAELQWQRQSWSGQTAYAPGVINQVREQNMQTLRAAVRMPVGRQQSVQFEIRQVRNKENISIFQYNDRQLQLSWQWHPH